MPLPPPSPATRSSRSGSTGSSPWSARGARCSPPTTRIGVDAGGDGLLVLLVSGRSEAAPAVFARLRERWEAEGHVGALHARYAIVNDREPIGVTVARASAALADLPRGGGSTLRAA
jgi:hypothetical protein